MTEPFLPPLPPRLPTGIAGLDTLLSGGFLRGGIYLVMGPPGAGKTTLGNQICFNYIAAAPEHRVLYVSLLAETYGRMFSHMQAFSFFTREPISDALYYISGFDSLEKEGLTGLVKLLRTTIRERKATLLIIDGLTTAAMLAPSDIGFKRFINELQATMDTFGCTTLMLSHSYEPEVVHPEYTMVDGLIELSYRNIDVQAIREIQIRKFRGSATVEGRHRYAITADGIVVHPRLEARVTPAAVETLAPRTRQGFGVTNLDTMLGGGLLSGTTTILQGTPGSGKTLLGLHFLAAGAMPPHPETAPESALYFGFHETPPRIISAAQQVGLALQPAIDAGHLALLWQPGLVAEPDALADRLLDAVERRGVRRLFIDGFEGFWAAAVEKERMSLFFIALVNALRVRHVTTLVSVEMREIVGGTVRVPTPGVAAVVDNLMLLRAVELRSQLYRLLSIVKERETAADSTIREFTISAQGIAVAGTFASAEAILTGIARLSAPAFRSPLPEGAESLASPENT